MSDFKIKMLKAASAAAGAAMAGIPVATAFAAPETPGAEVPVDENSPVNGDITVQIADAKEPVTVEGTTTFDAFMGQVFDALTVSYSDGVNIKYQDAEGEWVDLRVGDAEVDVMHAVQTVADFYSFVTENGKDGTIALKVLDLTETLPELSLNVTVDAETGVMTVAQPAADDDTSGKPDDGTGEKPDGEVPDETPDDTQDDADPTGDVFSVTFSFEEGSEAVKPGDKLMMTTTVKNVTDVQQDNVVVKVTIPEGLTYTRSSLAQSGGVHTDDTKPSLNYDSETRTLTLIPAANETNGGHLIADGSITLDLSVTVSDKAVNGEMVIPGTVTYGADAASVQTQEFQMAKLTVSGGLDEAPSEDGTDEDKTEGKITLTFDTQDGSAVDAMEVESGANVDLSTIPVPEKEGFTFLGWALTPDSVEHMTMLMPEADTTLYALWKADAEMLTVTLDTMTDEVTVDPIEVEKGSVLGADQLPVPSRVDYDFVGWYTEAEGGRLFTTSEVTEDMTLYARWNEKTNDDDNKQPSPDDVNPDDDDPNAQRYTLTITMTDGSRKEVSIAGNQTLDSLAQAMGLDSYASYGVRTSTSSSEEKMPKYTTLGEILAYTADGEALLVAYDDAGTAVGSAKISRTGEYSFNVVLSKETDVDLGKNPYEGKGEGVDDTPDDSNKTTNTNKTPSTNGKKDNTAESVQTADALPIYGGLTGVFGLLSAAFAVIRKKFLH